jgi:hypothetical protein
VDEVDTRLIPYSAAEVAWALERPAPDRSPIPAEGDEVDYRHDPWGPVRRALVLWVQPLDDFDDPHLWMVERDPTGAVLLLEGKPIMAQRLDPWPLLRLQVPGVGIGLSREARLRGSAGWLPLNWRARRRPMPSTLILPATQPAAAARPPALGPSIGA